MNNWQGIGRICNDIEVRYTASQTAVAKVTVAIDEGYGDKKKTNFISCIVFGKTAENLERFSKKGLRIAIQGHISTGSYERDGQKRYTTDVIADRVEFIDFKEKNDASSSQNATEDIPDGFAAIDEQIPF